MNFVSDNAYGASPHVIEALAAANAGTMASYGADGISARLTERMGEIFEHDVAVFPVATGTAANALALATLVPPHGAVICHADAHIAVDECGAPEFFTHGAKLLTIAGENGKISPVEIAQLLRRFEPRSVHQTQPAAISITQASERGTCYRPDDVVAIAAVAHEHGLKLHMDGARLANALAFLGCSPAEATWRAGVDVLSFGATKNGALCADAVVFFNRDDVRDFEFRRKKSGHLVSKMRFLSAQILAILENDRWLQSARLANAHAARLARELKSIPGTEIAHPVEANAVFAFMPNEMPERLRAAGAQFYDWEPPENGRTLVRLVCSFATQEAGIAQFIEIARG